MENEVRERLERAAATETDQVCNRLDRRNRICVGFEMITKAPKALRLESALAAEGGWNFD
jgi:hypothetical protein